MRSVTFLVILFISFQKAHLTDLFVTPLRTCGASCSGDLNKPYDNLLFALQKAATLDPVTIILLNISSLEHYVLDKEKNPATGTLLYEFPNLMEFSLQHVEIRPLFCDEDLVLKNKSLLNKCYERKSKAVVVLKTLQVTLNIKNELMLQNIVFDGIESGKSVSTIESCATERTRCCISDMSSTGYVKCDLKYYVGGYPPAVSKSSFIKIDEINESTTGKNISLSCNFIEINNFKDRSLKSFIQTTGKKAFDLVIADSKINDVSFGEGLISHMGNLSDISSSNISITNVTFTKYNYWDTAPEKAYEFESEGFLLFAENKFKGSLKIAGSTFENLVATSQYYCYEDGEEAPNEVPYFPVNNLFGSYPGSRSDIWSLHHNNAPQQKSSIVYIRKMEGSITIKDSTFREIIGVYGSVLRVDDCELEANFDFQKNTFDKNFAMSGFANVIIVKKLSAGQLECPRLNIMDSDFINSSGCPGSFGNVGIICYWDSEPSARVELASYPLLKNLSKLNFTNKQVSVSGSKFQNNLLSVSNSLAIVGSLFTSLDGNIFQDNGGTTAEIIKYSLNGSNFLSKKPEQNSSRLYSLTHFGQSTAVLLDRVVHVKFSQNIFQRNWGPWEGSQALASSLTIKNWCPSKSQSIFFKENSFIDNWGIPSHIAKDISDKNLKKNSYMPPLVAFSYDPKGESLLKSKNNSLHKVVIELDSIQFTNNTLSYDFSKACTYNANETSDLCTLISAYQRDKTGLIKLLSLSDAIDDGYDQSSYFFAEFGLSLINTNISHNRLETKGCLFPTLWIQTYFIENLKIENNSINPLGDYFSESYAYYEPFVTHVMTNRDGVFCIYQKEAFAENVSPRLIGANLQVINNIGTIFNLYPTETNSLTLTNSIFVNNSCPYGSVLHAFTDSKFLMVNNLIMKNTNALGFFFETASTVSKIMFNSYLMNEGQHASLGFSMLNSVHSEFFMKSYWNTVNPKYKFFKGGVVPQGGLYFLSTSAELSFTNCIFKQNYAYGGAFVTIESFVSLRNVNITDNFVTGLNIIGSFLYSSSLSLSHTVLTNNTIVRDEFLNMDPSIFSIVVGELQIEDMNISKTEIPNTGSFLNSIDVIGNLSNIAFEDYYIADGDSIFVLDTSTITIQEIRCHNITSIFKISRTTLILDSISIEKLEAAAQSKFIAHIVDSVLQISDLNYKGNTDAMDYFSLVIGSGSSLTLYDSHFLNAAMGQNQVFYLKDSMKILVQRTSFTYQNNFTKTTIFDLVSAQEVYIQECTFVLPGQVLIVQNVVGLFYFSSNTIITNAHVMNFEVTQSKGVHFIDNKVIRQWNDEGDNSPNTQFLLQNTLNEAIINNNVLISLYGYYAIIQAESDKNPYNINSSNNILIDNTGALGGALHLHASLTLYPDISPQMQIKNSVFLKNRAVYADSGSGKGGAIYQTTPNHRKQITTIENCIFLSNNADITGGAIYFDFMPPKINNATKFKANYATKPNHIASYPVKLGYYEEKFQENDPYVPNGAIITISNQKIKWKDVASGLITNQTYIFALLDMFNQRVYDDSFSYLHIIPDGYTNDTDDFFSPVLWILAENGLYEISDFRFTHKVGGSINITLISDAIDGRPQVPLDDSPLIPASSLMVEVSFRDCWRGEYITATQLNTYCVECQTGFFQVSPYPNVGFCSPCDDSRTFCLGGDKVGPKQGYWRYNETADLLLECPVSSSCLGNQISNLTSGIKINAKGECDYGYRGNFCSNCISGWAKTENGICTDCNNNWWFYFRAVLTLLLQLVLIVQGVRGTMTFSKQYQDNQKIQINSAILIRILTNYLQLLSLVSGIAVTWPGLLKTIFSTTGHVASAASESVFTLDCLVTSDHIFGIRIAFFKLLVNTLGGFALAFLGIMFWTLYHLITKTPIFRNKSFTRKVIKTCVVICFMMQPNAIQKSFSFFECMNLYREDNSIYFFQKDYDVKCWEGSHLYWTLGLGVSSLVIWAIVLPVTCLKFLKKNKDKLSTEEVSEKYSFLYAGYAPSKYYWEFVIMARKFLLVGITVSARFHSTNLEIYIAVILIMICYVIHMFAHPFEDPSLNSLERLGLLSAATVNFAGLYFMLVERTQALDIIVMIIGLTANFVFFFSFGKMYFVAQIEKLKQNEKVYRLLTAITKKFSCCLESEKLQKVITRVNMVKAKGSAFFGQSNELQKLKSENPDTSPIAMKDKWTTSEVPEEQDMPEIKCEKRKVVSMKDLRPYSLVNLADIITKHKINLTIREEKEEDMELEEGEEFDVNRALVKSAQKVHSLQYVRSEDFEEDQVE